MLLDVFDKDFKRIEKISSYSFASYSQMLNGSGSFGLLLPLDEKSLNIVQYGLYILFERDILGVITYFRPTVDITSGKKEVELKGSLINSLLERRCIPATQYYSGTVSNIARNIVKRNCIAPTDSRRRLPIVLGAQVPESETTSMQLTGNSVAESLQELLKTQEMGYILVPRLTNTSISQFIFRLISGSDRTIGNSSGNPPVVFSRVLRNVYDSTYTYNSNDFKTMAYVAGEGEGQGRTVVEAGNASYSGLERFELYIDARDLQKETEDGRTLTDDEYKQVLLNRGISKLSECEIQQTYETSVDRINMQYEYGKDYSIGDLVTIQDPELNLTLGARITQIDVTSMGEKDLLDLTFGYYRQTTTQKLRRGGII